MRKRRMLKCVLLSCLLCLATLGLHAQEISVVYQNAPMEQVLNDLAKRTNYTFVYQKSVIAGSPKVNVKAEKTLLFSLLTDILKGSGLEYEVVDNTIVIRKAIKQKGGSNRTITGQITDENGEELWGVSIRQLGSQTGTTTDDRGQFQLVLDGASPVLKLTYVGMEPQEIVVNDKTGHLLLVKMKPLAQILQDVVVTGYQTISKERSAGSYNIIKGDDIATKSISANSVIDGLEGLTTGLSISHNSGADKYLIRGTTSLNSNRSPLFVVDGIPLDESLVEDMINSNDIQSVTVLKDATAASIWGSQAANGVIVITTKRGENNQKVKVSYNGSFTYYGRPDYSYYDYMDGKTFIKNAQEMFDIYSDEWSYEDLEYMPIGMSHNTCYNGDTPVILPHEIPMYQYKNGEISLTERDAELNRLASLNGRKQYEDYFMSPKLYTQHNVALRGGSQKHTYFLSLTYKGDQGDSKDWTDKVTINSYQDFKLTDWLKWDITVNANFSTRKAHLSPFSEGYYDEFGQMNYQTGAQYRNLPYNIFSDSNGMIDQSPMILTPFMRQMGEELTGVDMSFFPVEDFNRSTNKTVSTNLRVNTGLNIKLYKGLNYEGRFQYSRIHSRNEMYRPTENYIVREERVLSYDLGTNAFRVPNTGGHYLLNNSLTTDWTLRNQINYNASFDDDKHQVTALLGTELRSYVYTSYINRLRGYDMQTMKKQEYDTYAIRDYLFNTPLTSYAILNNKEYQQAELAKKYFSLYANAAYTYNHKYTLNASLRMDQSNLFGSDPSNQYKPIWSVGAAWRISEEAFMEEVPTINALTLRASFGLAGNSPLPGTGGKYDILTAENNSRFETPGFALTTPANDMLTWEQTRIINAGFDVRLLNNRIGLSFDFYDKYTKDLIGLVNLNPTTGWLSTTGNIGEMSNRGFEAELDAHIIKGSKFNWSSTLTLSYNKNKLEKMEVEDPVTLASDLIGADYVEGYPMGALFSYRYAGLDDEGRPQAYDKDGNIVRGLDTNNMSKEDAVYSGSTVPKFYGGFTNRLSYKDFELSFMMVYNFGHKMRDEGIYFYGRPGANIMNDFDKRWRNPGDEKITDIPHYTPEYDAQMNEDVYYRADTRVLNAGFIRMRDVTLSYNLPRRICKAIGTESIKLTGQIGNLFLIALNGEGIDPEAFYYNGGSYGAKTDKYGPSYSFGVNVNF